MTMGEGGQGTRVGAANFGIGIDLAQFERDLDRAEQLARTRATRIQANLGAVPIAPLPGSSPSAPRAGASGGGVRRANVPAYVQTLYDGATAQGMSDADAKRSISRELGIPIGDLSGLGGGPTVSASVAATSVSRSAAAEQARVQRQVAQQFRADQQRAERDARLEGRAFSNVRTGRTFTPPPPPAQPERPGPLDVLFGQSPGTSIRAAGALIGVGLGLSAVVGVATQIHKVIVDTVQSTVDLSQAARNVGVAFGEAGRQFTGPGAAAFGSNPLTRGTTQQFLSAAAGLAPIANQFGLTNDQVQALVVSEGQLARIHGVELPQAAQVLQQVLRGNVEAGQALDLELVDQNGRLRSVGLTFDELVQSVGRARAEQQLFRDVQAEVGRQLQNSAQNSDDLSRALDRLRNIQRDVANEAAKRVAGPAAGLAGGTADLLEGKTAPTQTAPSIGAAFFNFIRRPDLRTLGALGATVFVPSPTSPAPLTPAQFAELNNAATAQQFANEQIGPPVAATRAVRDEREVRASQATEQANRAQIGQRQAQAQLDILSAESDLRRLGVQGQINEVAQARLDIEGRLSPVLLEQQRLQDEITLATRERLDLTQRVLQAQQALAGPSAAAQDLSFAQQRVRLLAQIQQSRAIRGLGPAPGVANIPELFGQAQALALAAPDINLSALDAQHRFDVESRTANLAQIGQRLGAIPGQQQLQDLQARAIPLQQAERSARAAADAIERSLQGADLAASPQVIEAQKQLTAFRLQEAQAARELANLQAGAAGGITANANVSINGLTDVQEAVNAVLEAFRPQLVAAINDAINNPRPPSGPPGDRGNR